MVDYLKTELSDAVLEYRFPALTQSEIVLMYRSLQNHWDRPEGVDLLVSDRRLSLAVRDWQMSSLKIESLIKDFEQALANLNQLTETSPLDAVDHVIDVKYGGDWGPDILRVADASGMSVDQWISKHQQCEFVVQFNGFLPGFSYLAGGGELTQAPRLEVPRTRVPRGSLAVAAGYCGIYPSESPGGWNVVGQTDLELFDPEADPPSRMLPGDRVRFRGV